MDKSLQLTFLGHPVHVVVDVMVAAAAASGIVAEKVGRQLQITDGGDVCSRF